MARPLQHARRRANTAPGQPRSTCCCLSLQLTFTPIQRASSAASTVRRAAAFWRCRFAAAAPLNARETSSPIGTETQLSRPTWGDGMSPKLLWDVVRAAAASCERRQGVAGSRQFPGTRRPGLFHRCARPQLLEPVQHDIDLRRCAATRVGLRRLRRQHDEQLLAVWRHVVVTLREGMDGVING